MQSPMPLRASSRFNAQAVVALKLHNDAQRLEIKFTDAVGAEHVVSLPAAVGLELAGFISDASQFMLRLKRRNGH
jgi:hypothetical protein